MGGHGGSFNKKGFEEGSSKSATVLSKKDC